MRGAGEVGGRVAPGSVWGRHQHISPTPQHRGRTDNGISFSLTFNINTTYYVVLLLALLSTILTVSHGNSDNVEILADLFSHETL